jgi:hypothetical protein
MTLADDLFDLLLAQVGEEEVDFGPDFQGASDGDTAAMRRAAKAGIPLADFEDEHGALPHDKETNMAKPFNARHKGDKTECRECGAPAPRFGRYAGLCGEHARGLGKGVDTNPTRKLDTEDRLRGELPPRTPKATVDGDTVVVKDNGWVQTTDPLEAVIAAAIAVADAKIAVLNAESNLATRTAELLELSIAWTSREVVGD